MHASEQTTLEKGRFPNTDHGEEVPGRSPGTVGNTGSPIPEIVLLLRNTQLEPRLIVPCTESKLRASCPNIEETFFFQPPVIVVIFSHENGP